MIPNGHLPIGVTYSPRLETQRPLRKSSPAITASRQSQVVQLGLQLPLLRRALSGAITARSLGILKRRVSSFIRNFEPPVDPSQLTSHPLSLPFDPRARAIFPLRTFGSPMHPVRSSFMSQPFLTLDRRSISFDVASGAVFRCTHSKLISAVLAANSNPALL